MMVFYCSITIFLVIFYANPIPVPGRVYNYTWIGILVAILAIFMAVLSLIFKKKDAAKYPEKTTAIRWVVFAVGLLIELFGMTLALCFIYLPQYSQSLSDPIGYAVWTYTAAVFVGCVLLYLASKLNSSKHPNFMRWVTAFLSLVHLSYNPCAISCILIFAVPSEIPVNYPEWASIQLLAYIPLIVLFTLIARDSSKPIAADAKTINPQTIPAE